MMQSTGVPFRRPFGWRRRIPGSLWSLTGSATGRLFLLHRLHDDWPSEEAIKPEVVALDLRTALGAALEISGAIRLERVRLQGGLLGPRNFSSAVQKIAINGHAADIACRNIFYLAGKGY